MTKTELLKTIREHCLDCCCGSYAEVEQCGCPTCNLYPLRFGKDPTRRVLSPEELEQRRKNLGLPVKKSQESNAEGLPEEDT